MSGTHFRAYGREEIHYDARLALALREAFRTHLRRKARALELVDHLFGNPFVTVARAAELLGTSGETARQAIMVLEESEILEEVSGRSWRKLYLARPIYEAIQA